MGHHHHHNHSKTSAERSIGLVFLLNASFALIELVGGYLTGSIAIISDSLHDFGDCLALGMAYFLQKYSRRSASLRFSYGFHRLSLLAALISGFVLIVGSIAVVYFALGRLQEPSQPYTPGMLGLAVLGVLVNGYGALKLARGKTMNEKTLSWHLVEDILGWVSVLIVALIMTFWDIPILDPILSIFFSGFIVYGVSRNLFSTIQLFLQGTPSEITIPDLKNKLESVSGVIGIHDVHLWSLDGENHILSIHAVVAAASTISEGEAVKAALRLAISEIGTAIHTTIELESEIAKCEILPCSFDNASQ